MHGYGKEKNGYIWPHATPSVRDVWRKSYENKNVFQYLHLPMYEPSWFIYKNPDFYAKYGYDNV